jgi:hypothetical protein
MYIIERFSIALIGPLEFGGNPRSDLAASEGVFRTTELTRYGHWHMP